MTAFLKIANQRPCHSPSPGGEGRGEGELHTDSGRDVALRRPQGQPKIARRFSAGTSSLLSQVPAGRLKFSHLSPFLSLPSISPSSDILISTHLQFSESRAVKPCQALSGPVKRVSRKKI